MGLGLGLGLGSGVGLGLGLGCSLHRGVAQLEAVGVVEGAQLGRGHLGCAQRGATPEAELLVRGWNQG